MPDEKRVRLDGWTQYLVSLIAVAVCTEGCNESRRWHALNKRLDAIVPATPGEADVAEGSDG